MTDPSRYSDREPDTARRWVRVAVFVAIAVALLIAIMLLAGGGGHSRP